MNVNPPSSSIINNRCDFAQKNRIIKWELQYEFVVVMHFYNNKII